MYNVRRILSSEERVPEILDKGIAWKKREEGKGLFCGEKIWKHTDPRSEKQEIMQRP